MVMMVRVLLLPSFILKNTNVLCLNLELNTNLANHTNETEVSAAEWWRTRIARRTRMEPNSALLLEMV